MPLLHLTDRPAAGPYGVQRRQGIGALASGASHAAVASLVFVLLQLVPAKDVVTPAMPFDAGRIVWVPNHTADGGGKTGGGDRSTAPARRAQRAGEQAITVPAATAASSTDATIDPPPEPLTISAQPMSHGTQLLAGTIASESASDALGPGNGSGGDGDGPTRGQGRGPGDGIGDGVRRGGPGVTTPVVIQQVKPQYTADAMRAKIQGSVWLECVVLPDGSVGDVRVTRSLDRQFGLDQEAIAAARQWRFKPGLANGRPVPVAVSIELTFTLR
jgi:protein TonB